MSTSGVVYYLIVAALTFLVAIWIGDKVMQGFAIGAAMMAVIAYRPTRNCARVAEIPTKAGEE